MIGKLLFYPVYGIVVAVAAVVGFIIGMVSVLPGLVVSAIAAVLWCYEVLTHWWFGAHEELHRRSAAVAGVPVEDEGVAIADGGSSSHVTYSIRPEFTPTPGRAAFVALAPLSLVLVALVSFVGFRLLSFPYSLLFLLPALSGRYSRPTGPDSGSILNSGFSDPFHPLNFVFVPVAVVLFLLDLPRSLHYRLSYFSDALWFSLLYVASRPVASALSPYIARLPSFPVGF